MKNILFVLILLNGFALFAQKQENYRFQQLDAEDLGVNLVIDIHWDSHGLAWMLTDKGLIRYNGYSTTRFRPEKNSFLLAAGVREIHTISKDEFWLSYDSIPYLSKVNPSTGEFEHFEIPELKETETSSFFTTKIFKDSKNQIWIAIYTKGILKLQSNQSERKFYNLAKQRDTTVMPVHPSDIDELKDGRFLISYFLERDGKRSWPVYFDPETGEIEEFGVEKYIGLATEDWKKKAISQHMTILNYTYIDDKGKFWFGTYSGLYYCDPDSLILERVSGQNTDVAGNLENAREYIIQGPIMGVATSNQGIMMVNMRERSAFYVANDPNDPRSLRDNRVISMSRDPQGNYWILTRGTGISIYSPIVQQFDMHVWSEMELDFSNKSNQTIPVNQMLVSSKGYVYLSHGNGVNKYDPNTGNTEVLPIRSIESVNIWRGIDHIKLLSDTLFGIGFKMYAFFDQNSGKLRRLEKTNRANKLLFRHSTYADELITYNNEFTNFAISFYKVDRNTMEPNPWFTVETDKDFDVSDRFSERLPSGKWLMSEKRGRFIIIDPVKEEMRLFSPSDSVNYFPDSTILCAYVDYEKIWFGTQNGIYLFDPKTGKNLLYNDSIGLHDEGVYAITRDQKGDLWMALKNQLVRKRKGDNYIERFDKNYGLNVGEFLPSIAQMDQKGYLYFATRKGLLRFHPDAIRIPNQKPKLLLSSIFLNEVLMSEDQIDQFVNGKIQLAWDENNLILDFYTNQVFNLKPNHFYYRINGAGDWISNGSSNRLRFRELKYGNYSIEVKVVNGYGISSEVYTYNFTIARPFWLSWWFYLVILILMGIGVYFYIKYREKALRKKSELLEEKVKERTAEVVEQKREAEHQRLIVEEKQREITDSIKYAKRIQSAIMPTDEMIKEHLPDSFVLYKPKDIVAGDFYWLEVSKSKSKEQEQILIAAADCTGHGVPGAMVSVVCNSGLNRSVREFGLTDPGAILDKTRELVIQEFEKSSNGGSASSFSGNEIKDGMDIALVSMEQQQEEGSALAQFSCSKLTFSGAHNPLWIIRQNAEEVEEIKGSKQPIGKYHDPQPFESHSVSLQKGDTFYIFSDGYADQFGGDKGKKFKTSNLKKLFLSIQDKSLEEQKQIIDDTFETWRSDHEQLDDVCVIGVRV
ncbi:MAG: SpoIIE family protein phosphatase [Crocinitomicaceae bacterium]